MALSLKEVLARKATQAAPQPNANEGICFRKMAMPWEDLPDAKGNMPNNDKIDAEKEGLATGPTDHTAEEQLNIACRRYNLHRHRIGASDLLPLLDEGIFTEINDLISSVEHLGWYLQSDGAVGIGSVRFRGVRS